MSLPAVLSAAETTVAAITGIVGHAQGAPLPDLPWSETPYVFLEWDGQWTEAAVTMGGTGRQIERQYGVLLTLMLGSAAMEPQAALSLAGTLLDRMRAAFASDPTLSSACFTAFLTGGTHNLRDYHDQGVAPLITCHLAVTEYLTASAASQT